MELTADVGARVRAMLFDPDVPNFAFVSQDEVCAAFSIDARTLRTWRSSGRFPDPADLPGVTAFSVEAIREFLKDASRQSVKAYRTKK